MIALPSDERMYRALVSRDAAYDGVFFIAVRTTGIFCRPSCPAKKPGRGNVLFYPSARDALLAGYRPCKRCRPLDPPGAAPEWARALLDAMDADPARRWRDADLSARGLEPARVRRWFSAQHGMTFHAYQRARRIGSALGRLREGASVTDAALDHGFESPSGFHEAFRKLVGTTPSRSREALPVHLDRIVTPLGPMLAAATDDALVLLEFFDRRMLERQLRTLARGLRCAVLPGTNAVIRLAGEELRRYFAGELRELAVPLYAFGSSWQRAVWNQLRRIPYGETRSYADVARALGRASAVRAVARANGDNRLAIVIPCHRVVGSDGQLTGYGGGLWRKRALLDAELRYSSAEMSPPLTTMAQPPRARTSATLVPPNPNELDSASRSGFAVGRTTGG